MHRNKLIALHLQKFLDISFFNTVNIKKAVQIFGGFEITKNYDSSYTKVYENVNLINAFLNDDVSDNLIWRALYIAVLKIHQILMIIIKYISHHKV